MKIVKLKSKPCSYNLHSYTRKDQQSNMVTKGVHKQKILFALTICIYIPKNDHQK